MAPAKTTAEAVDFTHEACVPSLQLESSVVQTESDITINAILIDWKLY